jgi:hypothetical protein
MKIVAGLVALVLWLASLAAYFTHIVVCLKAANYVLLVIGCIIFPVGAINGYLHLLWFFGVL